MPLVRPGAGGGAGQEAGPGKTADAASRYASSIFESYAAACGGGGAGSYDGGGYGVVRDGGGGDEEGEAAFLEGMQRVEEHLLSTQSEVASCLICLEGIGASEPIWHCTEGCYEMVHLVCIQQWARQQLAAAKAKAEQHQPRFPGAPVLQQREAAWGCPKCRQEYPGSAIPSAYHCFCGKAQDPPFDPWNAPHSCGERCERESKLCGHPCMLLCHPGPCPPCPRIVRASCYCGALEDERRCGRHEFSCGDVCGQMLPCGHSCPELCHKGPCPPCALVSEVPCRCGGVRERLPCSEQGVFQCGRVCGRTLGCGRHTCSQVCHAGPCGECELAGEKRCPCGKQVVPGAPCDLVVPPCGSTCDKLLACGIHRCHERCHTGPCPQVCRGLVEKTCGCGKTTRVVQCHEPVKCERRCAALRSCGRHPCKRRCCNGVDCPPCEEVCGRRLRCGNHRCPAPCHAGPCPPCPLAAHISCACGKTSYSVPCGREKLAPPPPCKHPCPVRPLCRHAAALPLHRCHFGPCPGPATGGAPLCPLPCGTPHPRCGHPCQSACCHDPLPPPVPDYAPPPPPVAPVGPGAEGLSSGGGGRRRRDAGAELPPALQAAQAAAALAASLPRCGGSSSEGGVEFLSFCPPCQVPVPVTCLGGHQTVQVPCSSATPFSCGAPCGRALACTNHACGKACHDPAAEPCEACEAPCAKRTCGHPCPERCHPGECPRCEEAVTRACHCGKTSLQFACWDVAAGLAPDRLRCPKTCHRALPHCPHLCTGTCHAGACPAGESCREAVTVRCGCKRRKERLPCREVQALLLKSTGSRDYHAATPLRMLPCDAECAAAAAVHAKAAGTSKGGEAAEAGPKDGGTAAAAAAAAAGAAGAGAVATAPAAAAAAAAKPADKRSAREAREEERRRQRQLQASKERRRAIATGIALVVVVLLVALAAMALLHLLRVADLKAQQAWRPGGVGEEL